MPKAYRPPFLRWSWTSTSPWCCLQRAVNCELPKKKSTHIDIIASSLNSIFRKYLFSWSHSTFCVCSARFRIKLWNVFKCEVFCVNLLPREITWLLQAALHPFFSGLTERIMSRVWRIGFRACLILSIHFYWSITSIRDVWFLFSLSLSALRTQQKKKKNNTFTSTHAPNEWRKPNKPSKNWDITWTCCCIPFKCKRIHEFWLVVVCIPPSPHTMVAPRKSDDNDKK